MSNFGLPYGIDARGRTATAPDEATHIENLIKQVLFTVPGERVMRPEFGTPLLRLVFEGASDALAETTKAMVQGALQRWLGNRIIVVKVDSRAEESKLTVEVAYKLVGDDDVQRAIVSTDVVS